MKQPVYHLTLTPQAGHWQAPPVQRLRLALKVLLRGFGLRCTECRPCSTEKAQPVKTAPDW
jgi:hypothetical protein